MRQVQNPCSVYILLYKLYSYMIFESYRDACTTVTVIAGDGCTRTVRMPTFPYTHPALA